MKKVLFCILYWLLSLTWGILMTIPGLLTFLVVVCFRLGNPHINGCSIILVTKGNWGGLSLGPIALCGNYYPGGFYNHTRMHEFGHSLQNCLFGPLFIFLVGIPSVIRYWIFRWREKHCKPNPEYDSIWFEGTATRWGRETIIWLEVEDDWSEEK